MATSMKTIPQDYPRIQDENSPYHGCLDDITLVPHERKIPVETIKSLILEAISNANSKSSREILSIPAAATTDEINKIHEKEGRELFKYFKKYCGDPASTAHQVFKKHYRDVGIEQFRNRTLQKERMNSGWRYQFLVVDCAHHSKRFKSVSDIGAAEADFNATIDFLDKQRKPLSLYVSVKNRSNTMGGQDWPKAIQALENVAKADKNKTGPYCCVFGIAMDRGSRYIKRELKTKTAHSVNTEVWLSDYFWPFFANYSYDELMLVVLNVLLDNFSPNDFIDELLLPQQVLESFGDCCRNDYLLNDEGYFNDPYKLLSLFLS